MQERAREIGGLRLNGTKTVGIAPFLIKETGGFNPTAIHLPAIGGVNLIGVELAGQAK